MRVDEEYGQRKGWDEENNAVDDYMGVKRGVIVGVAEMGGSFGLHMVDVNGRRKRKEAVGGQTADDV